MGLRNEANYGILAGREPCRVSQDWVRRRSRKATVMLEMRQLAVEAPLYRSHVERSSGEIGGEQLQERQWGEHCNGLEVSTTRQTNICSTVCALTRAVQVGKSPVIALSAGDAAQAREPPLSEAAATAQHPLLL